MPLHVTRRSHDQVPVFMFSCAASSRNSNGGAHQLPTIEEPLAVACISSCRLGTCAVARSDTATGTDVLVVVRQVAGDACPPRTPRNLWQGGARPLGSMWRRAAASDGLP
mmetsp:Transcript_30874/g.80594  ORF Transcript_30874/g.80594 Transcript_30874/m.80594 type:complete len:110 (+) Transcript_30874:283-612(+)